jgi:hypothetical protein
VGAEHLTQETQFEMYTGALPFAGCSADDELNSYLPASISAPLFRMQTRGGE